MSQQDRIGEGGFTPAHTPGPWWASATREVFNTRRRTVCRAHLDGGNCSREEALANAHLIAAAPDNYRCNQQSTEMLEAMLAEDWLPESAKAEIAVQIQFNRAALAKARGEQS